MNDIKTASISGRKDGAFQMLRGMIGEGQRNSHNAKAAKTATLATRTPIW